MTEGIVADEADEEVKFHPATPDGHLGPMASSVSSLAETGSIYNATDPYDFSCYMDKVRLEPYQ